MLNCSDKIHQGGGVAAPVGAQVLGEILPYLEVRKDNETDESIKKEVSIPNIVGLTVEEAEKTLKGLGLEMELSAKEEIDKKHVTVKEQFPTSGISVYEGTKISAMI